MTSPTTLKRLLKVAPPLCGWSFVTGMWDPDSSHWWGCSPISQVREKLSFRLWSVCLVAPRGGIPLPAPPGV